MNTSLPPTYQIDLDAYFQRIGFTGARSATLETLRSLHLLHTQAIPFENLDPLLHRPVPLDLPARVLLGQSEYTLSPRSHMLLLVRLEQGSYIADVGFGGNTLTVPLLIDTEAAQDTPHGPYRALRMQGDYLLQTLVQGEWQSLYRFDLTENFPVDYVAIHYYLSTCDASHFRHSLFVALATSNGRHTLFNDKFTTHTTDGGHERTQVNNARVAAALLEKVFGIVVPDHNAFSAAWSRMPVCPYAGRSNYRQRRVIRRGRLDRAGKAGSPRHINTHSIIRFY